MRGARLHAGDSIAVTIKVSPLVHKRLGEAGRAMGGYKPTQVAQRLFEAAYAARVGQQRGDAPTDADLDAQVTLVFACAGHGDAEAVAKATGLPVERVVRILDAWQQVGRGL